MRMITLAAEAPAAPLATTKPSWVWIGLGGLFLGFLIGHNVGSPS